MIIHFKFNFTFSNKFGGKFTFYELYYWHLNDIRNRTHFTCCLCFNTKFKTFIGLKGIVSLAEPSTAMYEELYKFCWVSNGPYLKSYSDVLIYIWSTYLSGTLWYLHVFNCNIKLPFHINWIKTVSDYIF